jgi:hypothetical protein
VRQRLVVTFLGANKHNNKISSVGTMSVLTSTPKRQTRSIALEAHDIGEVEAYAA